jgi:universal stress protein A
MEPTIKNILFPTDFSYLGNHTLQIAIELCRQHGAVLHLLHVVENRYIINGSDKGISLPSMLQEIDAEARAELYNIYESVISNNDITVQIHMPTGIPFDEICKAAEEMPIDLIVMGTHGASGYSKFFIGTTAYNVIKNTTKPVLTVPGYFEKTSFNKILFAVRPQEEIKDKFNYLETLLCANTECSVHIAAFFEKELELDLQSNNDTLRNMLSCIKNSSLHYTQKVYNGKNYAGKVEELTESLKPDLIVINATLDYIWTQFFVCPHTRQVLNQARVPVLSYRQGINVCAEIKKRKSEDLVKKRSVFQ